MCMGACPCRHRASRLEEEERFYFYRRHAFLRVVAESLSICNNFLSDSERIAYLSVHLIPKPNLRVASIVCAELTNDCVLCSVGVLLS
jgi:hypothetical protein